MKMKNVNEDISGHRPLKIDVINLLSFVMIQVPYITIKTKSVLMLNQL